MPNQPGEPDTVRSYCARKDVILILILVAGLFLRLYLASVTEYIWDENQDWIRIAEKISLRPGNIYLPLHDFQHPSLPACSKMSRDTWQNAHPAANMLMA